MRRCGFQRRSNGIYSFYILPDRYTPGEGSMGAREVVYGAGSDLRLVRVGFPVTNLVCPLE